jgi:hypothetical protein
MRKPLFAALPALALLAGPAVPLEKKPAAPRLKALLITGGGYHDYKVLNPVITKKVSALASVHFTVKSGLDVLKNKKFADGYDVLVYNFCFAGDDWTDCCGMKTRRHDAFAAFQIVKADKDHPAVKTLPDEWRTPGDELYQTIELGKRSTALLKGKNKKTKSEHVICWVSTYGKGKVFATTLGHDLKTTSLPEFHRLLANGLLWACGKLGKDGKPLAGYAGPGAKDR